MGFGLPQALLLLLGAVPLILFLHSLKPRGLKIKTTTLFLWERVLKERPVGTRLGRLFKKNLLLLLQLLVALFLIAAMAQPWLAVFRVQQGDLVAVLDLSASMMAKGRSGSRFDELRRVFLSSVDGMARDQKMMVIGAGPVPRILSPFTSDKGRLKATVRSLRPSDAPAEVKEAILFAHSFLKRGSRDRILVFSDGAFDGAEELPWASPHLRWVRIEGKNDNVGILGFEFRRLPDAEDRYEIMVRVKNFSRRALEAPLRIEMGGKKWLEEKIKVAPQQDRVLIRPFAGRLEARATAILGVEDDFPTDNRAYLVLSESPRMRVLYAGKGNPFLLHFLRLLPGVELTHVDRLDKDDLASRYDVIIVDRIPAPPLTRGNFILIGTVPGGLSLEAGGKIFRPRPLPPRKHPLTEGLRLDDVYIRDALRISAQGGIPLVESSEGPLILALERGRLRALVVAFDFLASDLPFKVAFPVLLSNALNWFRPERSEFPAVRVQAGSAFSTSLPDDRVEVITPTGRKEILPVASNPFSIAETLEVGFYTFRTRSGEGQFAVNLFSESESDLSSRIAARHPPGEEPQVEKRTEALALWPALLVLASILLALEGFLALRGSASFYPLAFRLLALGGAFGALVNPQFFRASEALDVVFAVDYSWSVGKAAKEEALRLLRDSQRIKGSETRAGLLFFGREPAWEFWPRADIPTEDFSPQVARDGTDIQAALLAAISPIGEGREGRILLLSDGNENRGEASRILPLIRSRGVPVWVLPVSPYRGKNEISVSDLALPLAVASGEAFEVRGAIDSLSEARARIKLLRDGFVQKEEFLTLKAGRTWVRFRENLDAPGRHSYELLVESSEDTLAENNLLQGTVEVKGSPRVLYVHSGEDELFFSRVLKVQGFSVLASPPEESPLSLAELSAYDLLVLDNVPAYRLSAAKMEAIESYVRDLGGGLLVIGGHQSYGAGGYYRTPFERLLPVEMRPPTRVDIPHVALLFVLDKSGSMGAGPPGATKLDLAKAAAMAAAELLNPSDQVGILAFDAGWEWVLPFQQVGRGDLVSERLSALQADGGTDLYKAMAEAYRSFSARSAAIKHILVLSDGLTDKADFRSLVQRMVGDKITVSTVALGEDADLSLLGEIAKEGKGRGYVTHDPRTIPQIFTTETLLVSRDLLVEKLSHVTLATFLGPLKGLSLKRFPPLRGYVLAHPKARAELLMKVDNDPLLVSWRYGLGKVVAFTSDLGGRWGREWVRWEDFPQWAGQIARSAIRRFSGERIRPEVRQEGEGLRLVVDLFSPEGGFVNELSLKGKLTGSDGSTVEKSLRQIAPGRYESRLTIPKRGIYFLTLYEDEAKGQLATIPFVAPYPKEYRELEPNMALLRRLAEESGGEIIDPDKSEEALSRLFAPDRSKATIARESWWGLTGLSLLLFLGDLGLRRLPRRQSSATS